MTDHSTLLLYSSRYGAAKQYADWLAGKRDCDLLPAASAKLTLLRPYQTLIWMGSVYSGEIQGLESLRRVYRKLRDQRVAIFAVGAAPDESYLEVPGELSEIPLHYGRGRWDPASLDWKDSLTINMQRSALARKPDAVPAWMKALLTEQKPQDFMEESYLEPLLDFISGY